MKVSKSTLDDLKRKKETLFNQLIDKIRENKKGVKLVVQEELRHVKIV